MFAPYRAPYWGRMLPLPFTSQFGLDVTNSTSRFPTSSARDEPTCHSRTNGVRHDPLNILKPSSSDTGSLLAPEFENYVQPTYLKRSLGVREDGALLATHPYVAAFIAKLPSTKPDGIVAKETENSPEGSALEVFTVHGVLGIALERAFSESIFVLAALQLLRLCSHPAHLTLWGAHVSQSTAHRVQRVMGRSPRPIVPPTAWSGIDDELPKLRALHKKMFAPPTPPARELRKDSKKAVDAAPHATVRRRKGPMLSRRKGGRHNNPLKRARVDDPSSTDEIERPTKRVRVRSEEELLAVEALVMLFKQSSEPSSVVASPQPADTSSPSHQPSLLGPHAQEAMPSPPPARRSARLARTPSSPPEHTPDACEREVGVPDVKSPSACQEEELTKANSGITEAVTLRRSPRGQQADVPPSDRAASHHSPKLQPTEKSVPANTVATKNLSPESPTPMITRKVRVAPVSPAKKRSTRKSVKSPISSGSTKSLAATRRAASNRSRRKTSKA